MQIVGFLYSGSIKWGGGGRREGGINHRCLMENLQKVNESSRFEK